MIHYARSTKTGRLSLFSSKREQEEELIGEEIFNTGALPVDDPQLAVFEEELEEDLDCLRIRENSIKKALKRKDLTPPEVKRLERDYKDLRTRYIDVHTYLGRLYERRKF